MIMLYNRSELSMSRTGTNGGIRRGAAAAAIGAVLVLTTGVPASQATEGSPDPGDPAAPAVDTASLPVVERLKGHSAAAREEAPGRNRDRKDANGKAPAGKGQGADNKQPASPSPVVTPSASAVPSALRPAVRATQKPDPTPEPTPTATASPVPTASAPASSTPAATRPEASAAATSAPASPGTAPGAAPPASNEVPESLAASAPAAPAAPAAPEASAAAAAATAKSASPESSVAGNGPATGTDRSAAAATAGGAPAAGTAAGGQAAYVRIYSVPQTQPGWTPYAAAIPGNSVRTSAKLSVQPEPKSALVWLGSGLVGVAGAAGLVFFRLRNP
ncbi:hypothetical protein [Arthrobacter sp. Z4-13]